MAKVEITLSDELDGGVGVRTEFVPEYEMDSTPSSAQVLGAMVLGFLQARAEGPEALQSFVLAVIGEGEWADEDDDEGGESGF